MKNSITISKNIRLKDWGAHPGEFRDLVNTFPISLIPSRENGVFVARRHLVLFRKLEGFCLYTQTSAKREAEP